MKKTATVLAALIAAGIAGFFILTMPAFFDLLHGKVAAAPARAPDLAHGQELFNIGGCSSCHMTPGQTERTRLGGGMALPSPFGTFYVPNISSDATDGIGGWTPDQFIEAMRRGVSPDGRHFYPAFPYTSYQRMAEGDLADLFGFLKTLPAVSGRVRDHDLPFPFSIRRTLGLWKLLFMDGQRFQPPPGHSEEWNRGAFLVEGPGHCAECHSPRNILGGIVAGKRFSGGPNPDGKGYVPNITQDESGLKSWSKKDIAELLKSGFTPEYDSVGGSMTEVIKNTSQLSDADRAAMAEYLKSYPAVAGRPRTK